MDKDRVLKLVREIRGCTFASLSSVTTPSPGIRKVTSDERIMLFGGVKNSYEKLVKRRLAEAGKNPDDFVVSDLAWGRRIDDLPVITYKDNLYLQTILLDEGSSAYYIGKGSTPVDPANLGIKPKGNNQGLTDGVKVRTYNLDHITRLALLGEVL